MLRIFISNFKKKWINARRFNFIKRKPSTKNLVRFLKENKTNERTLVVHSEDVDYLEFFPNSYSVTKRKEIYADFHTDIFYRGIEEIQNNSFNCILCTGLLEHIPEPQILIDNFYRILKPKGKLIISASSVFSIHEGPNDYLHFTHYSFAELFKKWDRKQIIRGSSKPFETLGILMNRILLQCDIFPPIRPIIEIISLIIPFLDRFIMRQFDCVGYKSEDRIIDSMLPSNIQAVFYK